MRAPTRPRRKKARGWFARVLVMAGLSALVVGWFALGPTALGGSSTYVTTYGNSMEPLLHRGDLVMVRRQPSYQVGDVVAYRSHVLGTVVLHRIIGRDGDRYVVKGDHNSWVDADRPLDDQLIGKMAVHLPGVGSHVQRAASPPAVAALASVAFMPLVRRGRRRRSSDRAPSATRGARFKKRTRRQPTWGPVEPRLLLATAIGVGVLGVAFTRPLTISASSDLPFNDEASFTYTGDAPNGRAAYLDDHVSSGQPVFLSLVEQLDVAVDYRASSTAPLDASGEIVLTATVSDANGWTRPIELARPTRFSGAEAAARGTLDLAQLRTAIAEVQMATGIVRDRYLVNLQAVVTRTISHAGASTEGIFTSKLEFNLSDREMHLTDPDPGGLTSSSGGLLSVSSTRENSLEILGRDIPVPMLRIGALAAGAIVLVIWFEWLVRSFRGDAVALIDRRYRSQLLPVLTAAPPSGPIVQVERMADLARMADQLDAPILRRPDGSYDVLDGPTVYRHTVSVGSA